MVATCIRKLKKGWVFKGEENTPTFIFPFYGNAVWTMLCTPSTTTNSLLSRTGDYEHERGENSAYVTVSSHEKHWWLSTEVHRSRGDKQSTAGWQKTRTRFVNSRWADKGDNSITAVNHGMLWHSGRLVGGGKEILWGKIWSSASNSKRQKDKAISYAVLQVLGEHNTLLERVSPWKSLHLFPSVWSTLTETQDSFCNRAEASAALKSRTSLSLYVLKSQNFSASTCMA